MDPRTGGPICGGSRAFFARIGQLFLLASEAALKGAKPVNSRGVRTSAVARQVAKMTGGAAEPPGAPFPGCAVHIWQWFLRLVPFEAARWLRGDVDLLRCQALIAALEGDAVCGYELTLLGEVIGQYVQNFAADQT